jgi:PTS system fructose IIA component
VDRGGGVLGLPDLGSSVLTTLTVLEDHPRTDVLLVDAPFVEGAVAAAVTAASGADLRAVAHAARQARAVAKFDAPQDQPEPEHPTASSSAVILPANLHARPAGLRPHGRHAAPRHHRHPISAHHPWQADQAANCGTRG